MLFEDAEPLTTRVEPVTSREPCGRNLGFRV